MTLFEYLSAAFSLVLALGVSRGLNGVRSTFMVNRRYWPHVIWLTTKLLNAVAFGGGCGRITKRTVTGIS
jgi:hypothetical protein